MVTKVRYQRIAAVAVLALTTAVLAVGCGGTSSGGGSGEKIATDTPIDKQAVADFMKSGIKTYSTPNDWANWSKVFQGFCAKYGVPDCQHTDTDMTALQFINHLASEAKHPVVFGGDTAMSWTSIAEQKGVNLNYIPPSAKSLPKWAYSQSGGWVGAYSGAPVFLVNRDALDEVPESWADLLKPEYKGKVGMSDPRSSGTGVATFLAANYALGGSAEDLSPGLDFFHDLQAAGNIAPGDPDTPDVEKGNVPILLTYDFVAVPDRDSLRKKGIDADVVMPKEGSIYSPSVFLANRYFEPRDAGMAMLDYVLSDEAQTAFAEFGARPIRYVTGDLKLPKSAMKNWLPESMYKNVKVVEDWNKVNPAAVADGWSEQVIG